MEAEAMTPNQWIEIGRYTSRFVGHTLEAARGALGLAGWVARGAWRVSVVAVKFPFLAMNIYIESRMEGVALSSRKAQKPAFPQSPHIVEQTTLSSSSSSDTENFDDSDAYSGSESEGEADFEANPYMSLHQKQRASFPSRLNVGDESFEPRTRARTSTLTLSETERKSLARELGVSDVDLEQELTEFNKEQEDDIAAQGLMQQVSSIRRAKADEECLDDEESPEAMARSVHPRMLDIPVSEDQSPAESLRFVERQTSKKDKRQKTGMAKHLDPHYRGSRVRKLLEKKKNIPACEYEEVAAAFARSLDGHECGKRQMKTQFQSFISTYQSRLQRLVPALVRYMDKQSILRSQPLAIGDINNLNDVDTLSGPADSDVMAHFSQLIRETHKLAYAPILGKKADNYYNQTCKLKALLSRLSMARVQYATASPLTAAFQSDLCTMEEILKMKLNQVEVVRDNDQRKYCYAIEQAEAWEMDARSTIRELKAEYQAWAETVGQGLKRVRKALHERSVSKNLRHYDDALQSIDREAGNLRAALTVWRDGYRKVIEQNEQKSASSSRLNNAHIPNMVAMIDAHVSALTEVVKAFKGGTRRINDEDVEFKGGNKRLNEKVIDRLEFQDPQGVSRYNVPLMVDGKLHTFQATFTPAKDYVLEVDPENGQRIHDPVGFGHHFPCSANRNSEDAQNLVVVEVRDEAGNLVRREVRVGTLVPYLVENEEERLRITHKRCTQALTQLAAANHEMLDGMDDALLDDSEQTAPVNLPFSYVCYLSPDKARSKTGFHEDEFEMVRQSKEVLDQIAGTPQGLTFGTGDEARNVSFNVKPKMFVFPVNMLGFNETLATGMRTFTLADQINDESMKTLIGEQNNDAGEPEGEVGEFLASAAGQKLSPLEREELTELCDELRHVITNRLYHHAGKRPFYPSWLVEQISLRTNQGLLDGCKSAKDRTNNANKSHIVDSCMAFARRLQGFVGTVWQRLGLGKDMVSPEMAENQTVSHVTCGGLKQQWANCGKAGYKVDGTARGAVDRDVYRELTAN